MKNFFLKIYVVIILLFSFISATSQVINAGVGGNNTNNLLDRINQDVLTKNPDLVILMVGTNDMLNSKKMISYDLYESNLKKIVEKIKNTGTEVMLMSSPPVDSIYLFERHDKNLFKETPNVKLDTVQSIVSRVAINNNLKYLDLHQIFEEMNLPKHNEDLFFRNKKNSGVRDGVHPTFLGYQFIGETVFYFLKENQLLIEGQKIICFGDSITRGNKDKSYPEVLQKVINASKKSIKN